MTRRAVVLTTAVLCLTRPVLARPVDFLHITASVGGSTGGHYALRFGDDVYHFQNDDLNQLALDRVDAEHFRWVYTVLQNRTIDVARVEVPDDAYERLRDGFNARYLVYKRQRALLTALQHDRQLLDAIEHRTRDGAGVADAGAPLPGGSLFGGRDTGLTSPALARLRARVRERYGFDFVTARMAGLRHQIQSLRPVIWRGDETVLPDRAPAAALSFSERYEALAQQYLALDVLERAAPVAPEAVLAHDAVDTPDALSLTADERAHLANLADRLEDRLVALVGSQRSDSGFALLVGMARLDVAHASVATGRLVLLDAYPTQATSVKAPRLPQRAAFLHELLADAEKRFNTERTHTLSQDTIVEHDFNRLEEAGNRFVELWRGVHNGSPVRVYADTLMPGQQMAATSAPLPGLTADELVMAEAAARDAAHRYASALENVARYHLTHHNCVTEIFRTIEAILGRTDSIRYLGGYIDPDGIFTVAPFTAHRAVIGTYAVTAVGTIPSYRLGRVAEMEQQEPALTVYLREANTLTSSLYRPNDTDSFFLFFTDDAVLLRPLYGVANLAAGLGQTLWGVATSSVDHGHNFSAGALGMVYSLPELMLMNVRKGTFEYGPAHAADVAVTLLPISTH